MSSEYGLQIRTHFISFTTDQPFYHVVTLSDSGLDAKGLGQTQLNFTRNLIGGVYESGALVSFKNNPSEVIVRVGISFKSLDQACSNAETEIGSLSFEDIVAQSKALWNEKLAKIEVDFTNTPQNVTEMLYSSLYRSFLTPVSSQYDNIIIMTLQTS